jgi:hypothetical protein
VVESWSVGVVEWWSGGVVEWWSGGVVEWWSGGVVEWWSGGAASSSVVLVRVLWGPKKRYGTTRTITIGGGFA